MILMKFLVESIKIVFFFWEILLTSEFLFYNNNLTTESFMHRSIIQNQAYIINIKIFLISANTSI